MADKKILILGGTGEARALANMLAATPGIAPITSLAGMTKSPLKPAGDIRIGGFGGVAGLEKYLNTEKIDALIDASHPYAAQISAHAKQACDAAHCKRLMLMRPAWQRMAGDNWIAAKDMKQAAGLLAHNSRVFITTGRKGLTAFSREGNLHYLIRTIEKPEIPAALADCKVVLGRGPFSLEDEINFLKEHHISVLISKNSGGAATYAKIKAARELKIPVIMINRPALPQGEQRDSIEAAAEWASNI